ncbi:phytoene desaturase family protein [Chloroflexota bacterium]
MGNNKYDVVVAGSGLGGLCSAALLARHDYKVLLVEKLERLGGRFSTIEQEGFKVPTGAVAIATRGVIEETFKDVGAPFDVREIGGTSVWIEGQWHELPEKGQIRALLSLLDRVGASKMKILGHLAQKAAAEKIVGVFRKDSSALADPANTISFREWLSQYTDDKRVLQVFHALTSAISTVNDFEYPVSHWFTYVSAAGQGGMPYHGLAPRGNIELANALAATVKTRGGDVWTDSPIEQITIKEGNVTGLVVSKEGSKVEVDTRVLISNMGPKKTVELAGRSNFNADYLKQVDDLKASPIVHTLIASDKPLVDAAGGLLIVGSRRLVTAIPMTSYCPELAPPGQHLTVAWGTPASCLQHIDKEEEAKANLEDIREVFSDFDKHGRILRMDVRDIDDDFPALRSWMGYDMPQETPLPNLLHVGDAVKPFGWEGLAACAKGARIAVDRVRKQFKPGDK